MAVTGGDEGPVIPAGTMFGLSWEGIIALLSGRTIAHNICGTNYDPMPSHGPGVIQLQVIETDLDKRRRLKKEFTDRGWTIKHEPQGFIVFRWKKT